MSFATLALIFFLIMDPLGNISSYLSLVDHLDRKKRKTIVLREMLIALSFMLAFYLFGEYIFTIFGFSETTVRLTSGLILFLAAIKILFTSSDNPRANLPKGDDPLVFPLAIPLIAGPALLATIMLYAHLTQSNSEMLAAIFAAWGASISILFFAESIKKHLGEGGLIACERLIGMILVLLSVQRILEAILIFWSHHPHVI